MSIGSAASSPAFIDTNVWLYAFNASQDTLKSQQAKALIRQTPQIVISTQVVNEVSFNLLRKFQADERDVRRLVRSLYRKYLIADLSRATFLRASDIRSAYQVSYWDSLIIASALAIGADILYTEDLHNGLVIDGQLRIMNPFHSK